MAEASAYRPPAMGLKAKGGGRGWCPPWAATKFERARAIVPTIRGPLTYRRWCEREAARLSAHFGRTFAAWELPGMIGQPTAVVDVAAMRAAMGKEA